MLARCRRVAYVPRGGLPQILGSSALSLWISCPPPLKSTKTMCLHQSQYTHPVYRIRQLIHRLRQLTWRDLEASSCSFCRHSAQGIMPLKYGQCPIELSSSL